MRKGHRGAWAWWIGSNWESETGIKELYPAIKLCCSQSSHTHNLLCLSVCPWVGVCLNNREVEISQSDSYILDRLQKLDEKKEKAIHTSLHYAILPLSVQQRYSNREQWRWPMCNRRHTVSPFILAQTVKWNNSHHVSTVYNDWTRQHAKTSPEGVKQVQAGRCSISRNGQSTMSRQIIGGRHCMNKRLKSDSCLVMLEKTKDF